MVKARQQAEPLAANALHIQLMMLHCRLRLGGLTWLQQQLEPNSWHFPLSACKYLCIKLAPCSFFASCFGGDAAKRRFPSQYTDPTTQQPLQHPANRQRVLATAADGGAGTCRLGRSLLV